MDTLQENGTANEQEPVSIPISPPDGCISVTQDGGVVKYIAKEGSGEMPVLHARCLGTWTW